VASREEAESMGPAQAVHFSIVPRNIDRDQKARLAFLAAPRADDFQGGRYRQTRCHTSASRRAWARENGRRRLARRAKYRRPDYRSLRAYLGHCAQGDMRVDPKESAGSRANGRVMCTL